MNLKIIKNHLKKIISIFAFIEEEPYKKLIGHQKKITDLSMSLFNDYYLLS